MNYTETIGITAAAISALVFLPQLIRTVKTRHTKDLSLATFLFMTISNSLWATYGILVKDIAIILAQAALFPMGLTILIYKLRYK